MKKVELLNKLNERTDRSAWDKAITLYAYELVESLEVEEIPEDFTECLLSISNDEIIQSKIKYLVNEKINPVTPIITKKGVETIKYELRKKFVSISVMGEMGKRKPFI